MPVVDIESIIEQLTAIFGRAKVRTDHDSLQHFGCDATKIYTIAPLAIVFPTRTEQVQSLVKLATKHQIGLVPSGGRTGLSGGAVANNGEIVVSFDYMNQIGVVNVLDRTVVCQPGVITQQLQQIANDNGLYYPVDFASAGSSQIGGNISTNAGGIKVIRYGMTRDWIAGLKVVTGTGELLELNKDLLKNNTGYDLRHLFAASEGTLGFIVEATMKLTTPPQRLTAVVLGIPSMDVIMNVLQEFQQNISVTAFEFFSESGVKILVEHGVKRPFDSKTPFYVLLEFESILNNEDKVMQVFEQCLENGWVTDGVISQNDRQHKELWALRENLSETCAAFTPYKNDISVTISKVPALLAEVEQLIANEYPDFTIVWWGHIGDGNLHINILKPESLPKEEFLLACQEVTPKVFEIVANHGGSISAEHGVGLVKRDYLEFSRSRAEIDIMKGIKNVFDPGGIMNPGKLLG